MDQLQKNLKAVMDAVDLEITQAWDNLTRMHMLRGEIYDILQSFEEKEDTNE